jgi:small GTP-binding protein
MAIYGGEISPKLIVVGETSVGKTSILQQWLNDTFTKDTPPTIGAGLSTVQLLIHGSPQTFNIWDTAGTPEFRSIVPMYCRQAALAIIVFDLTVSTTFQKVRGWYDFVRETADPGFLLVGNKLDLAEDREVDSEDAKELARSLGCGYVETSACTREGIADFQEALREVAEQSLGHMNVPTRQPPGLEAAEQKCSC